MDWPSWGPRPWPDFLLVIVVQLLSHVRLFATSWIIARQAPCPWDSPGKITRVGFRALLQGNLPDSGIEPTSPALQADLYR